MKAVAWHGKRDVRVDTVPEPTIEQPTDALLRITTTAICGSDLHLYEVLGPFMGEGDILGHEPMGVVEEVGTGVTNLAPGDRVVVPFQIACGHCFMCERNLQTQCETTQVREQGMAARRSTCACRSPTTTRSRSPRGSRTSASSTSPTSCRRPGRRSSTPTSRRVAL